MKQFSVLLLTFFCLVGLCISNSAGQSIGSGEEDWQKCSEGSDLFYPPECPSRDPEMPVYFPFPYDCSQYYECTNGIARCLKCAPGTLWDQTRLVCNHPAAVTCSDITTPAPSPTTSKASTTNQPPTTIIEEPTGPCPEGYSGLIGHPERCEQFYLCDPDHRPCLFECPGNLCFNPELGFCDFPGNLAQPIQKTGAHGNTLNYKNVNRGNFAQTVLYMANILKRNNVVFNDPCALIKDNATA